MNKVKVVIGRFPGWFFTVVISLLILWLTLAPHPIGGLGASLPLFPGSDKLVHAIMFGALVGAILLDKERSDDWKSSGWGFVALTIAIATACGVGIEFAQQAMNLGRSFDKADMIADFAGAFIVGVLWHIISLNIDGGKHKP